jgi:hypothetical protein
MRIEQSGAEDLLRRTLSDKAADATSDLTFAEIRDGAAWRKRQVRRRRVSYLAAAAVVVVAAPAGVFTLTHRDASTPVPPANTTSDTPSPTPTTTPSGTPAPTATGLDTIPRGADAKVTYLSDGVVHFTDGGTARLPAAADDVTQFTPYHGGWLVIDTIGGLTQYDNTGAVVRQSHTGDSALAVSPDQMRTAFEVDQKILVGISTGMGDGENTLPIPADSGLVGFLGDKVLVRTPTGLRTIDDAGNESAVPGPSVDVPTTSGDLIGGFVGTVENNDLEGAVVDASTGTVLWHNAWRPLQFTSDGRYVAAAPVGDNGDPSAIAILDARTGDVVAQTPELGAGISLGWNVAWDDTKVDDPRLVFEAIGDRGTQKALLALDTTGRLTRVSDVLPVVPAQLAFVFAAHP